MDLSIARVAACVQALLLATAFLAAQEEGAKEAPPGAAPPGAEGQPGEAGSADPAAKEPEFKKEATRADFEKAKGLLDEGKARQAASLFKKARADAKSKEDRALVETWILATSGAQVLEKLRAIAKQGKLHAAYSEAQAQLAKYLKTPIAGGFKDLIADLEGKIVLVVQTFESNLKARDGKSYVDDPAQVFEGKYSLRWQNTEDRKAVPVRIEGIPRDWREFVAVELQVKVVVPPGAPEAVLVCAEEGAQGKAAKRKGQGPRSSFSAAIKVPSPGEWQAVRLPLADFLPSGPASLASIDYFQLQCAAGRQFDILIDRVVLVRKDPGPAGAKGRPAGKK